MNNVNFDSTVNSTNKKLSQSASDASFYNTLIIVGIIFLIFILTFLLLRHIFPSLYGRTPSSHGSHWWKFLPSIITISDDEIFSNYGLDAVTFTLTLKSLIIYTIGALFYGFLILIPVDVSGGNNKLPEDNLNYISGTATLSFSNIDLTRQKSKLGAHAVSVIFNTLISLILFWRLYDRFTYYRLKQMRRSCIENYSVEFYNISPKLTTEKIIYSLDIFFPNEVVSVDRVRKYDGLYPCIQEREKLLEELEIVQMEISENENKEPPTTRNSNWPSIIRDLCFWKEKVDKKSWIEQKISSLETKMSKMKLKNSSAAFVTFKTKKAARQCVFLDLMINGSIIRGRSAPNIADIRFPSYNIGPVERSHRRLFITTIFCIISVFWCSFIVFAQGLTNIDFLSKLEFFKFLNNIKNSFFYNLLSGVIPALIVTICTGILKFFLRKLVLVECHLLRSSKHRSYFSKIFFFYIFTVFLASIVSGTFILLLSRFYKFATNPWTVVEALTQEIPKQFNYFMNYITISSVLNNIFTLLQPLRLFKRILYDGNYFNMFKKKSDIRWLRTPGNFHYFRDYAELCLFFLILNTYSTLSSLMTPFFLIYFVIKYFTTRYFIAYCHQKPYESYGNILPDVLNRLFVSVFTGHIIFIGIFSLQKFTVGIVISVCCLVSAVLTRFFLFKKYHHISKYGYVNLDILETTECPQVFKGLYRDPIDDWRLKDNGLIGESEPNLKMNIQDRFLFLEEFYKSPGFGL